MSTRGRARISSVFAYIFAVVGVVSLGSAIVLTWFVARDDDPRSDPLTVEAVPAEYYYSGPASLIVTREASSLTYLGAGGIVTRVEMVPGRQIRDGDKIFAVDGIWVKAVRSDETFFGVLSKGDSGVRVAELQRALVRWGCLEGEPDDSFGDRTVAAVKCLQRDLGITDPDGVFRPGYVIRLAGDGFDPSDVVVEQDSEIVSGYVVAEDSRAVASMKIVAATPAPPGDLVLTLHGEEFSVSVQDPDQWAFDEALVAYVQDVSGSVGEDGELAGSLRELDRQDVLAVPPSTLVQDDESSCVWERHGSAYLPHVVEVIGSDRSGSILVQRDGAIEGVPLVLQPADVMSGMKCG